MLARYWGDETVTVSQVNPRTLAATTHYAKEGRTLCGKRVGRFGRWFWPLAWESNDKLGPATCPACVKKAGVAK